MDESCKFLRANIPSNFGTTATSIPCCDIFMSCFSFYCTLAYHRYSHAPTEVWTPNTNITKGVKRLNKKRLLQVDWTSCHKSCTSKIVGNLFLFKMPTWTTTWTKSFTEVCHTEAMLFNFKGWVCGFAHSYKDNSSNNFPVTLNSRIEIFIWLFYILRKWIVCV